MSIASVQTSAAATGSQGDSFAGIPVIITNNLSVPLDIYDVFNPVAKDQTAPYLYTKLGTIAAGAAVTVTTVRLVSQLEAMYTGTIPELQGWYYYQFPVKLMSGTQFSFSNPPPLSYTVAESDRQSMIESFLFHKFAMANPDSALTKNLNAALKQSDPKAVNAFFAGTQNFKDCTLSSWNAVMTWLTMFTSGWQGPYYLYETAPSNPPPNYVPTLIGTLNVVSGASGNSATLAMSSQDSNGNLQPLSPAQGSAVVMAGDGTMVDQNPGQDVSLTLTPVWMNTIQTTMSDKQQPVTSYLSGPTLTGTVTGKNVVSTQTLMPLPGQPQSGKQQTSGASSQTFGTICQVVGLIVGLVMLYEIVEKRFGAKETAKEAAKADAASDGDFHDKAAALDESTAAENAETFTDPGNAGTIAKNTQGVADGYAQTSQAQQKEVLTETIASEKETLNEEISTQLDNGMTPTQEFETAVNDSIGSFGQAEQQIQDGKLSEASTSMADAAGSMQNTLEQSSAELQQSEVETLQSSAEAIKNAADKASALNDAQDKYDENMENETDDSGFSDEASPPETEAISETG
jgi:hypothetical protein